MKKNAVAELLTLVITLIVVIVLEGVCFYVGGWITGWFTKLFIGETVVNGLNLLFNTDRFQLEMLPHISGTLSWISLFFYQLNIEKTNNN